MRLFANAAVVLVCLVPTLAVGSPIGEVICAPTGEMRQKLTHQFGESRQGTGMRGPDEIMELWSDGTGDWTLVMTYASGRSCIVAMGENWDGPTVPEKS